MVEVLEPVKRSCVTSPGLPGRLIRPVSVSYSNVAAMSKNSRYRNGGCTSTQLTTA